VRKFEETLGFSNGSFASQLKNNKTIGVDKVENILHQFKELNPTWLLTGEGGMLLNYDNTSNENNIVEEPKANYATYTEEGGIPLVELQASAGWGGTSWAITAQDVKAQYVIPKFQDKKVDFMIEVYGSSMYPKYNSGDIVACKIIKQDSFVQWNKVHVIATKDQGILVKRLKKSEDDNYLLCHSDNKDYEPFLIPREEIEGIALVIGVIRLE
jgi:phage repressor protein C with HTH and peptisase S24 domain